MTEPQRGLHIGLTGGIGSGKSTVAQILVELGAALVDTDAIARALTLPGGAAIDAIRAAFGGSVIGSDGALDRDSMRERVFSDLTAKTRLEAILHPMIGAECQRQAQAAGDLPVVFDVPLLVESSRWRSLVDKVVVVDCAETTQIDRVMQRSGWSREAVESVIAQQASRSTRRAAADAVICNDGLTRMQLASEVVVLWKHWTRVEQSLRSSGAPSP